MDLSFTAEQTAFRQEVKEFIAQSLPADLRRKGDLGQRFVREDHVRWQRILNEHGWGAPGWPVEYGGTGWDPLRRFIFDTECALARAPREIPFGLNMVAPVIMKYGTAQQKDYFLPRIRSLEHWWAQGYSEPGAGSDLASLKTAAVRDGEDYVVNGQKIWTTLAHCANWIFCLVRTSTAGKPQEGISFLLIDRATPGITVRPIMTIDGEHELNEVWFENVRVPIANRIGEENKGWTYAKYLLKHERADIARVGRAQAALSYLKSAAARYPGDDGRPLLHDPRFRDRLALAQIHLRCLEILNLKMLSGPAGTASNGPEASILKIVGSELHQEISELAVRMMGPYASMDARIEGEDGFQALPGVDFLESFDNTLTSTFFNMRKTTIYGGSSEVQKNIIAQLMGI